jgi:hypothetical protein
MLTQTSGSKQQSRLLIILNQVVKVMSLDVSEGFEGSEIPTGYLEASEGFEGSEIPTDYLEASEEFGGSEIPTGYLEASEGLGLSEVLEQRG